MDPEAKTTEFAAEPAAPNTFPVQSVPWVKVAPELNVIPLASAASNLCAAAEKVIGPLMLPLAPVATTMLRMVLPLILSCEPLSTVSESDAAAELVNDAVAAD